MGACGGGVAVRKELHGLRCGTPGSVLVECPDELVGVIKLPFVYLPLNAAGAEQGKKESDSEGVGMLVRRTLFLAAHKYFVVITVPSSASDLDLGVPDRLDGRHLVLRLSPQEQDGTLQEFLLQNAALVIGGHAHMLLLAMLYNRPILVLEPGWYSGTGAVHEVEGLEAFHALQLDVALPSARKPAILSWLGVKQNRASLDSGPGLATLLRRSGLL